MRLSTFFAILLFFGAAAIAFWSFRIPSIQAADLLSPVGVGKREIKRDSLLERILSSKTTDHYPPSRYFPDTLKIEDKGTLDIDASAYIAVDRDTRKILLGKNLTKRLPIASLSKIATAMVALKTAPLDLELSVSSSAASVGEATMGLTSGDRIRVEEALYGLLLPSGNDAAETLAEGIGKYTLGTKQDEVDGGGARDWFIKEMNKTAQNIGLSDTYFFNPSGLDEDSLARSNFSSVLDLSALTTYALENSQFASIVNTKDIVLPESPGKHARLYLYNILRLDETYPGIKGVKPGISDFADETLSSYIERKGRRIIVIILGSHHTKDDVIAMYKQIFEK